MGIDQEDLLDPLTYEPPCTFSVYRTGLWFVMFVIQHGLQNPFEGDVFPLNASPTAMQLTRELR